MRLKTQKRIDLHRIREGCTFHPPHTPKAYTLKHGIGVMSDEGSRGKTPGGAAAGEGFYLPLSPNPMLAVGNAIFLEHRTGTTAVTGISGSFHRQSALLPELLLPPLLLRLVMHQLCTAIRRIRHAPAEKRVPTTVLS